MIRAAVRVLAACVLALGLSAAAEASHLVTGNGFGFAVVAPESGSATKFYSHPYNYLRPDPKNPLGEGIETPNFIKALRWGARGAGKADYVGDSHVIRMRRSDGTATFFMPFGLDRPALIVSLESGPRKTARWHVEWNRALRSQRTVGTSGARLLRFDEIDESLLLIPLDAVRSSPG